MIESLRPETPYVVLDLDGIQGGGKSTAQRHVRSLIDPHEVMLRGRPKTVEDIWIAAHNAHVVSYENLSSLSAEQQDALCSLATGAGHAGRTLYTSTEETTIKAKRPIIVNGIGSAVTRPNLIDRTVHLELPEVLDENRHTEEEIDAAWQLARPRAFGALLTAFATALEILPTLKLNRLPRMADFAMLGAALAIAVGQHPEAFLDRYEEDRRDGADRALDAHPTGHAIIAIVQAEPLGYMTLTMQALLEKVRDELGDRERVPRSPRGLSALLKKIAPALRQHGVIVERGPHREKGNFVTLRQPERR